MQSVAGVSRASRLARREFPVREWRDGLCATRIVDATLLSAGRDDLGRLAPGALADTIIIDLSGRDSLRCGPVRDPVKSVVECGVGDDVATVIVGGKIVMQGGRIPGVDFAALRAEGQAAGENVWATLPEWDPLGRTAESACPWCYPMAQ
jgi:5-methylthioadenosine/S-adenosylhomocysteine deaminase